MAASNRDIAHRVTKLRGVDTVSHEVHLHDGDVEMAELHQAVQELSVRTLRNASKRTLAFYTHTNGDAVAVGISQRRTPEVRIENICGTLDKGIRRVFSSCGAIDGMSRHCWTKLGARDAQVWADVE